jgi:hypothetical protein
MKMLAQHVGKLQSKPGRSNSYRPRPDRWNRTDGTVRALANRKGKRVTTRFPMPASCPPGLTARGLQRAHERDEIGLLLFSQLGLEHDVEELDRVVQREQPLIVQVGR